MVINSIYNRQCVYWMGLFLGQNFKNATEATIDALIDKGFLRHKKDADGEVEILKWNAKG